MSEGPDVGHERPLEHGVGVERGAAAAVLRNRSFRNLLLASATSSIGDWIGLFALIALAETLAGTTRIGALAVSFVMIARIVPTLFIAPVAGVFVDRWDRKRTMIVTDVIRGVVMLGVAFVGDAFQLIIATFVIEVAAALFIPAKDATVPTIVHRDRLVQANQLSLLSTYSTLPVGALLCAVVISITERVAGAGGMVARYPEATTFLTERPEAVPIVLNALSFFVSIVFIQRMVVPDDHRQAYAERAATTNALGELRDGLAFIAGMPLIRALVVGIMTAFLAAGAVIGVGEFFATILNAGDAGFATLGFVVGSGLVAGIASSGVLSARVAKERLFAPGIMVAGVSLIAAAVMPTLLLASVPAFIMGWGAGISFILGYTMLQEYSQDTVRGRIFATFNTAVRVSLFAALVLGPLTITVLGVERTNAQIAQGTEPGIEDIEEFDVEGRYPYQVGGVRLTLIIAGLVAMGGAVWTGSSIAQVLRRREDEAALSALDAEAGAAAGAGPGAAPPVGRGVFVVFEGGEGAGKTTQLRMLRTAVERHGYEVVVTREPGGTPTGEAVREVLLDADGEVDPRAEALLYAADRAQHAADLLRPALRRGAVVLCDRFVDSSIVYQGVGRDLGTGIIADLNRWATDGLQPDLTILLDVPAEVGLARARDVDAPDRLEAAGLRFHEQVNEAFRHRASLSPDRYLVLDACMDVELLQERIRQRVEAILPDLGQPEHQPSPDPDPDPGSDEGGASPVPVTTEPLFEDVLQPVGGPVPGEGPDRSGEGDAGAEADGAAGARRAPGWLALPDDEPGDADGGRP